MRLAKVVLAAVLVVGRTTWNTPRPHVLTCMKQSVITLWIGLFVASLGLINAGHSWPIYLAVIGLTGFVVLKVITRQKRNNAYQEQGSPQPTNTSTALPKLRWMPVPGNWH